jgi:hypothetical protein
VSDGEHFNIRLTYVRIRRIYTRAAWHTLLFNFV